LKQQTEENEMLFYYQFNIANHIKVDTSMLLILLDIVLFILLFSYMLADDDDESNNDYGE